MKLKSPLLILNAAVLIAIALAILCCWAVLSVPYLGMRLAPDQQSNRIVIEEVDPAGPAAALPNPATLRSIRTADGGEYFFIWEDIIEEPDFLADYEAHRAFMARQDAIHAALSASGELRFSIEDADGEVHYHEVLPGTRPIGSLPLAFWLQLVVGTGSFLIGMWVWSLRQRDWSAGCFLLSGIAILCFALAAAVYSSRELALSGTLFQALSALNFFGASSFGTAMVALFMIYPMPLVRPVRLLVPLILFMGPTLYCLLGRFDLALIPTELPYLPTLIIPLEMLGIILMVLAQWFATRRDAAARAVLRWLGLSIVICSGTFVVLYHLPFILEEPPILSQGVSFLFFLLIYIGIALGLHRYRLFDLDTWAFRIMFYMSALIAFVFLDAMILSVLRLDAGVSTGIAILAIGFGYLPLRDVLWRYTTGRRQQSGRDYFQPVIDVAFAGTPERSTERWRSLLREIFDPLELEEVGVRGSSPGDIAAGAAAGDACLVDDGQELLLPATAGVPAQRLRYAAGGRRLFSSHDLKFAHQLVLLLRHAEKSRDAYEMGRTEERQRIAKDLHDDIGAGLLSGMHEQNLAKVHDILHRTMRDLRGIVGGLVGARGRLAPLLAELRYECGQRLEAAGVDLDWPADDMDGEGPPVSARFSRHLTSILREICSNVTVHSRASRVSISAWLERGALRLMVEDNGVGFAGSGATAGSGNGLPNMRRRVTELSGNLEFLDAGPGLRIRLELPLLVEDTHPFQSA